MNPTDAHESSSIRGARPNLRTTSAQASLIRRGAEASHKSMTDFALERATSAAG